MSTGPMLAVGVDVGGTAIKAGVVTAAGEVVARTQRRTPAESPDPAVVVDVIVEAAREAADGARRSAGEEVEGYGFGLPVWWEGPDWTLTNCLNIPALNGVALRPLLEERLGPKLAVDLDTNAATEAELSFGVHRDADRLVLMAIGTGISCGVAVDGRLLRFTACTTGDSGHLIVDPDSPIRCACGGRGCLEALASGPAIERAAAEAGDRRPLPALAEAARAGDAGARALFDGAGRLIGAALASYAHLFAPQVVLLAGGVAQAGDLILRPARAALDDLAAPRFREAINYFGLATHGTDAGMIGAATLILSGPR